MPQMMPINWIMLFFFFFMCLLIFLIMNYYNYNINPIMKNMEKNYFKNNFKWKW